MNSQKTKVLYLHAGAELYGADKILLELLTDLDKTKFKPIVLLPNDGPLVNKIKNIGVDVQIVHYPIIRRKFFTVIGILKYSLKYLKYGIILSRFVKKNEVNVIHVNTTAVLEGAFIKVFNNVSIVWHIHEIIMSPKIMFKFFSYLIQHVSNKIVTVSDATRNRLLESNYVSSDKIYTIYNGINSENIISHNNYETKKIMKSQLNIPNDSKVIGMVGRINSWKGQSDFVGAVNQLFRENKNIHAVMVGSVFEGEEFRFEELNNEIDKTIFPNQIHIVQFTEDIADFYSLFDVFVLPSTRPDPFPTVVLEAMANRLPIVAYNHGGITEMIEDKKSGYLVDVGQIEKLAESISDLVNNDQQRKLIGEAAHFRQMSLFNKKNFVKKFEKVYENVTR